VCNFVFHNHLTRNFCARSSYYIVSSTVTYLWCCVCVCVCVFADKALRGSCQAAIYLLYNRPTSDHRQYWIQIQKYISFYDAVDSKKRIREIVCAVAGLLFFVSVCKCIWLKPDNSDELYSISTSTNMYKVLHPASNSPCLSCLATYAQLWLKKSSLLTE